MQFSVQAVDSGKTIRVTDRIAGQVAFDGFVDLNVVQPVNVGSQDGNTGQVDILYAVAGPANTVFGDSPTQVTAGQILQVTGN